MAVFPFLFSFLSQDHHFLFGDVRSEFPTPQPSDPELNIMVYFILWYFTLIGFQILKHPCIPEINRT